LRFILRRVPGCSTPAEQVRGSAKDHCVTGESDSPLAEIADVCIYGKIFETTYRIDAMVSRMVRLLSLNSFYCARNQRGDAALARPDTIRQGLYSLNSNVGMVEFISMEEP